MMTITFGGKTKTIAEWAKELHISVTTLNRRRALGWSTERVIKEKLNRKIEGIAERDKLPDQSEWWKEQTRLEREARKHAKEADTGEASHDAYARRTRGRDHASAVAPR